MRILLTMDSIFGYRALAVLDEDEAIRKPPISVQLTVSEYSVRTLRSLCEVLAQAQQSSPVATMTLANRYISPSPPIVLAAPRRGVFRRPIQNERFRGLESSGGGGEEAHAMKCRIADTGRRHGALHCAAGGTRESDH
jgi:hypothetical protein